MSALTDAEDYAVPALSMADVAARAERFLKLVDAENLKAPVPLDIGRLVDHALASRGIDVYAVSSSELPSSEAETVSGDDGRVHVLVREQVYLAALGGDFKAHRARSTICHEIGHGVLHGPLLHRQRTGERAVLRRVAYGKIEAFRSAEWQAFAFGACLLMPISTMRRMHDRSPRTLSALFLVSRRLADRHARRAEPLLA